VTRSDKIKQGGTIFMENSINEIPKMPVGPLGIIAMESLKELGESVNQHIVEKRSEIPVGSLPQWGYPGYHRDSYLMSADCLRFKSGEGKAVIRESVRGYDLYILCDIGNYNCKFKMFDMECPMSPDDHFQDIKRIISAIAGKARRVNLIMPMLYQGRQHKRVSRESLDSALALRELENLGVENILTFDAHDPRVQNAIPEKGFENIFPTYQFIKALVRTEEDLVIDSKNMMVVSPDEGGVNRNLYYANIMGLNLGMFYKRRDLTRVVNGRNPIVAHEFLGESVEGKDVLIVDDMISSGDSMLDVAEQLKKRKARRIFIAVTYALFTEGISKFDEYYKQGIIDRIYSTNLTYRREELRKAPWYKEVDMSKFIALLINTLNHDSSISSLLNPSQKIHNLLGK
jgi:ribose-phosphate pyrophosphokinase